MSQMSNNCAVICAVPQTSTMATMMNNCVCAPSVQSQNLPVRTYQGSTPAYTGPPAPGWYNNQTPGYLPDYRGDCYTDDQRKIGTQRLNAPFFQSIGGEPQYSGGVPPKSQTTTCPPKTTQPTYVQQPQVQQPSQLAQNCEMCTPAYMRLQNVMQRIDQRIQQASCDAQMVVSPTTTCAPIRTMPMINCCKL